MVGEHYRKQRLKRTISETTTQIGQRWIKPNITVPHLSPLSTVYRLKNCPVLFHNITRTCLQEPSWAIHCNHPSPLCPNISPISPQPSYCKPQAVASTNLFQQEHSTLRTPSAFLLPTTSSQAQIFPTPTPKTPTARPRRSSFVVRGT